MAEDRIEECRVKVSCCLVRVTEQLAAMEQRTNQRFDGITKILESIQKSTESAKEPSSVVKSTSEIPNIERSSDLIFDHTKGEPSGTTV